MIYHWQKTRSIPRRAKVLALLSMVLAVLWSVYILPSIWLKGLVVALVAWPFAFICRLPNAEKQKTALLLSKAPDNSASKITVKNRKNL